MTCCNCIEQICQNKCHPKQETTVDTRELAEQSVERAIAAANNNEANIARAIMLDIELIEAHAPSMDDATLARAERTIQKLKLRRRTYSERPYRRKP